MDFIIAVAIACAMIALCWYSRYEDRKKTACRITDSECCGAEVCECVPHTKGKKVITQNIYKNRDGKRTKVGIITSNLKKGRVLVGYSLCCKTDEYTEKDALVLAGQRMGQKLVTVAPGIKKDMNKFLSRCARYYSGATIPTYENDIIKNG